MPSIDRSSVVATVARHLGEILEIDPALVTEDKTFVDDLGADSIALIELVDALEVEFSATLDGFAFDDDDLETLLTVRDAVDYVRTRARPWAASGLDRAADDPYVIAQIGEMEIRIAAASPAVAHNNMAAVLMEQI